MSASAHHPPPPPVSGPSGEPAERNDKGPWGFWPTLLFSVAIGAMLILVQTVLLVLLTAMSAPPGSERDFFEAMKAQESSGLALSILTLVSGSLAILMVCLVIKLRRGPSIAHYVGWHRVGPGVLARWALLAVAFVAVSDGLSIALGKSVIPPFMETIYASAGFLPLLWTALILGAPFFEEFFFRGFLFSGLRRSWVGPVGAVVLPALVWAVIHLQYDLYGITTIFVAGLLLGVARWRTGSLFVPILMHALVNLIATIEVDVKLRWLSGGA